LLAGLSDVAATGVAPAILDHRSSNPVTMSTNRWHEIWSRKGSITSEASTLSDLLAVAGWNTFGDVTETSFLEYVDHIGHRLSIEAGDAIFEVGCGAGAFLYPWHRRGHRVAGMDYAQGLVAMARAAMPGSDIEVGDASQVRSEARFDIVVSNGVFSYFADHDYAAAVLRRMVRTAQKAVAILDVADEARREAAVQRRKEQLGSVEYEKHYTGLEHLYYRREWFAEVLSDIDVTVEIADQSLRGYFHNLDRFNVFILRPR
jgi:trans-aconitate methyltransferase